MGIHPSNLSNYTKKSAQEPKATFINKLLVAGVDIIFLFTGKRGVTVDNETKNKFEEMERRLQKLEAKLFRLNEEQEELKVENKKLKEENARLRDQSNQDIFVDARKLMGKKKR